MNSAHRTSQIEPLRRPNLSVDQHSADALQCDSNPAQRICQEIGTKTLAGMIAVDRQPPDHGSRNRVRRIAPHLAWRRRPFHGAGRDAEIGNNPLVIIADDIGTREPAFVLQRAMAQPVV